MEDKGALWAVALSVIGLDSLFVASLVQGSLPLNPIVALVAVIMGRSQVGLVFWLVLIGLAGAQLLIVFLLLRTRAPKVRGDKAARHTGSAANSQALSFKAVSDKAKRLQVQGDAVGLPIGKAVRGGRNLYSSFEDCCVVFAGPRTGKTTAWCVPRILLAVGAVVATSNKRDLVDSTLGKRKIPSNYWVFDPQQIAESPQDFYWNPLTYVTDAVSARSLADIFASSSKESDSKTDPFFDNAARDLIAALLLAAALNGSNLEQVYSWLSDESNQEPVMILQRQSPLMADSLRNAMALPAETKGGVWGGAFQMVSFMLNEKAMQFTRPNPWMKPFIPAEFVKTSDTLYCLSQEGRGSATPIVTALTVAVTEAAVQWAKKCPGGRLSTPMLIELDEAANVCRWNELPDMYSHFGSRGINVDTVFQSWSQGVARWGDAGMKKLWGAANVAIYGGGGREDSFLSMLSKIIGVYWQDSKQTSRSKHGTSRSVSAQSQQRQIATISDLQALPPERMWVFASGSEPVLAEKVPYWKNKNITLTQG